jgi:hypothetical protein
MQNRKILPFNWRDEAGIEEMKVDSIDNEVILLDQPVIISTFEYPFKLDVNVIIICP